MVGALSEISVMHNYLDDKHVCYTCFLLYQYPV